MNLSTCKNCLLDTTANISLDENGICNYCNNFESIREQLAENLNQKEEYFETLKSSLKKSPDGYDCLVGLSGGVDSSYICLLAKELGLNPLLIHFDNGWNSETAVSNIKKMADYTGFDLHTYVINWPEFRDIQRAFIKAGVLDIEMITDHAIFATMIHFSNKFKQKSILSGNNLATEYGMPSTWSWNKLDYKNLTDIHKKYGSLKIKSYPTTSSLKWLIMRRFNLGMNFHEPLNYIKYEKLKTIKELEKKVDWVYYGEKHYESLFTKFYQAYILPKKFNIDKRKAHYSSLIRNNELTREEGLQHIQKELYPEQELKNDMEYVLKKLGFSQDEFDQIMNQEPVSHSHFNSDRDTVQFLIKLKSIFGKFIPTSR